jgi:WD40 repeat protein
MSSKLIPLNSDVIGIILNKLSIKNPSSLLNKCLLGLILRRNSSREILLITGRSDGSIAIFYTDNAKRDKSILTDSPISCSLYMGNSILITSHIDGNLSVLELNNHTSVKESSKLYSFGIQIKALCKVDENRIAFAGLDKYVYIYNREAMTYETLTTHTQDGVFRLCMLREDVIVVSDFKGEVGIWNINNKQLISCVIPHQSCLTSVLEYSGRLITIGSDLRLLIWDCSNLSSLELVSELTFEHMNEIGNVAIYGDTIAVGDSIINIIDVKTQKLYKVSNSDTLTAMEFINHKLLATGDTYLNIKIWDISINKCIRSFRAHSSKITSLVFDCKKFLLISCSTVDVYVLGTYTQIMIYSQAVEKGLLKL